ncbi:MULTISPECIES: MHYT domain-containing protein [Nostocales]|uniref:PAS domain-containing protein n=3 Tax=Nostocales TaxID=1161 RepID=A0A8S9SWV3_9CYAN|nr:MHYT domain-containing protein [Tolypothrix bouteillei]KAF3883874.1 PAS domain-containing protein [Tolypothrix bouteillei VB521301]
MLLADVIINSTYDLRLVLLSIVIAVFASYTALDLARRVRTTQAQARLVWLIGGAVVMGTGIWSMHFVAMLAFRLPIPMVYDVSTVIVSVLPAIVACGGALFLTSRQTLSKQQLLVGGVLMGIGIAAMHYIGMAAMEIDASTHYNPVLFALSVAIAIGASITALWIVSELGGRTSKGSRLPKVLSALIMGSAIAGMHYTGMAAASFHSTKAVNTVATEEMNISFNWLALSIGIATLVILGFTILTSYVDQKLLAQQGMLLQQQEAETLRSQLFTNIALRIRQSLNVDDVLKTSVFEVQQALMIDRVVIYRFNPDWTGTIVAEATTSEWVKLLGQTVNDPFRKEYIDMYKNGRVRAINNIYDAGFTDCHQEILKGFQIKSNIVAPIITNNELLGLMCGHQCSEFRNWQQPEIDLFQQLATQVGIALEQAYLLHELEQAQEVLRLRDRAIADASNAIVITDPRQPDNPMIFCNPAFESMTGYSQQEVIGRNCRFLQGPGTDPMSVEQIREAIRLGHECQVIVQNYRKDGTPFWNEVTISPVKDKSGRIINFIGIQTDITQRKWAEEELRLSKEILQQNLLEFISHVEEVVKGDLTVRAEITTGEIGIVSDFFNTIIESLRDTVTRVKQAALQVTYFVGENSKAIRNLADEALEQAEEITRTLDEIEQMNQSIQAVADSANQATEVARVASDTAVAAGQAMELTVCSILDLRQAVTETAEKVKHFGESSQQISKAVTLIEQIAMQTNLLSINASIEASRTNDESQGFGAVAQEISKLAIQSAEATQEIEAIAQNIKAETNEVVQAIEFGTTRVVESVQLVKDTKQSLERIMEISYQIDQLVQSISQATVSQARTSQAVAILMQEIAQASERTANSSRIVSLSLEQTVDVTQQLQDSVSVFKTGALAVTQPQRKLHL